MIGGNFAERLEGQADAFRRLHDVIAALGPVLDVPRPPRAEPQPAPIPPSAEPVAHIVPVARLD